MSERHTDIPEDPQVSALYREHARDEPSAAVDEHILAAARAAVSVPASVVQRYWWQRWRTGLALATTLALTLTLALLHERQPGNLQREAGGSQREAAVTAPQPVAPGVAPASPARDTAVPAAPPTAVSGDAAAAGGKAAASAEQEAAAGQASAARKQAGAGTPSRAEIARTADDWLDEIRALRRAGRSAEAAKQLADFRLAHPDYPLPEEFRQ